ncbi:MAG: tetratricopeptide repeat protein [Clostridium sp.]|nr:tetratricopeptide repeat protein [Prevotella sp.]MCM1429640.1 tetratricopeptide repeat protein [Clostridium sp.]MCM1474676.1 tetratricopeptide repeat protein [Muribaculaceae bacterium]
MRPIAYIFLICCSLLFPLRLSAQVNAEQVLNIGRNVLSMEDYMLAIQYFNQAIKAKPYLADAYLMRAIAKLSLDDYKGAEDDCSLAIGRNSFKVEAYKVRGFARINLGLDSLAVADFNVGLDYNPYDKYFLFYKSVAQTDMKEYQGADSTFSVLLRQYPKFDEGFSARAHMNILRGDTTAAIADIERAITLSKSQINPYIMRADISAKRRQWSEALADMDEVIRLDPDVPDLYINRAYLRYNNNDLFGAMSDYNYALELEPENMSAVFNRALLSYEVRDLKRAEQDFSTVLRLDPNNFHARYNRALIYLDRRQWTKAQADFTAISKRYPRFYPLYYGLAQCRQEQGDLRGAVAYMKKGDELVRRYVDNPKKNPLDRPTIDQSASNVSSKHRQSSPEEDDIAVMEKFNQLVTSGDVADPRLSYNERIKGRVQDRNLAVEPEPAYALSFLPPQVSLRAVSNFFRDLDQLNQRRYLSHTLYLVAGSPSPSSNEEIQEAFAAEESLTREIKRGEARPVDWLARGVYRSMLKNFHDAIADFNKALESTPDFPVALMGRGYARWMNARNSSDPTAPHDIALAVEDFDAALKLNPNLIYAWFNKGVIFYLQGDYTSALQCFAEAVKLDPEFGQAYFNRGLCYLNAGNSRQAFADLSKAGELGIIPSYNILKRLK